MRRVFVEDHAPFPGESPAGTVSGGRQTRGYPLGDPHTGTPEYETVFRDGMEKLSGLKQAFGNRHWWIRTGDRLLVVFDWRVIGEDHNGDEGEFLIRKTIKNRRGVIREEEFPCHRFLSRWETSIEQWEAIVEDQDIAREAYYAAFFRLWSQVKELFPSGNIEGIVLLKLRYKLSNAEQKKKRSRERRLAAFTARLNQIKKDPRPYLKGKRLPSSVPKSGIVIAEHRQFKTLTQSVTLERRKITRKVGRGGRQKTVTRNAIVAVQRWYRGGKITTARVIWPK